MNNYEDRVKLELLPNQTTYQNDYKKFNVQPTGICCKSKFYDSPEKPSKEFKYQDNETFVFWKDGSKDVPFDLLIKPNDITRSNPHTCFKIPVVPEDSSKHEVMKTRPRIYMSPAVSVDDVEDPEMRRLLCSFMYTTDWKKSASETAAAISTRKRHVPNKTVETEGDPVKFKLDLFPPLPKNFRNLGIKWEDRQMRGSVDPTAGFWTHKDPPVKCGACINPLEGLVDDETKKKISELIAQDQLRLAHDYPIPGYTGYKPMLSKGVSLAKHDLPVVHPFLSVTQAITKRYNVNTK